MPSFTDEALILRSFVSGENHLHLHLLARERGRRNAFAISAKSSLKRYAGALDPTSHIRASFTVSRRQSGYRLDSAELIEPFLELRQNLGKAFLAAYYCELLDALLVEGETYNDVFDLAIFFLNRLKNSTANLKHRLFFELRLLDLLGHRPDPEGHGATPVCQVMERCMDLPLDDLASLRINTENLRQAAMISRGHILQHVERPLKSLDLLDRELSG